MVGDQPNLIFVDPTVKPSGGDAAVVVTTPSTTDGHTEERYPVATVEFTRVETPFIIGVWILSASIAKIGEYLEFYVYFKKTLNDFKRTFTSSCHMTLLLLNKLHSSTAYSQLFQ